MSVPIDLVKAGKASFLYDGQFGSTGKGLAASWVGEHNLIDWSVTNASANAGHTSIIDGKPVVLFHLPSSFLTARESSYTRVFINKGAIVDLDVLIQEIEENNVRIDQIFVDPNAAVITPEDGEYEKGRWSPQTKVASTQKGCGAALSRKVERQGPNLGQYIADLGRPMPFHLKTIDLNSELVNNKAVMVEVPQGFSLSLSASGFYPYTTSRDCTLQQGMSDAGIHPRFFHKSIAVIRTYPIRVGNIQSEDGKRQIGYSGPHYPDQIEKRWEDLGLAPEFTTVTKRQRRIFTFSKQQYKEMLSYSRPEIVFLNFCNYCTRAQLESIISEMHTAEKQLGISPLHYYGYGAGSEDISEYVR